MTTNNDGKLKFTKYLYKKYSGASGIFGCQQTGGLFTLKYLSKRCFAQLALP